MKKILMTLILFSTKHSIAQPIANLFKIDTTQYNCIDNSLYNQLQVIDARENKVDFGIFSYEKVRHPSYFSNSYLVKYVGVKIQKSLKEQLEEIFSKQVTKNARDGKLLLVINRMYFFEPNGELSGKNDIAFSFSANLFVVEKNTYNLISSIDSNLSDRVLPFLRMSNKPLIKKASKLVFSFIESNLQKTKILGSVFSLKDINNWDSVLKSKSSLYKNRELKDGIYYSFDDLNNQTPNGNVKIVMNEKRELKKVFAKFHTINNYSKIGKRKFYGLVYNGSVFVSIRTNLLSWRYFELIREGNDFYINARKIYSSNINLFYKNIILGKSLSFMELKRLPLIKFKLEPSNGNFTPIELALKEARN